MLGIQLESGPCTGKTQYVECWYWCWMDYHFLRFRVLCILIPSSVEISARYGRKAPETILPPFLVLQSNILQSNAKPLPFASLQVGVSEIRGHWDLVSSCRILKCVWTTYYSTEIRISLQKVADFVVTGETNFRLRNERVLTSKTGQCARNRGYTERGPQGQIRKIRVVVQQINSDRRSPSK